VASHLRRQWNKQTPWLLAHKQTKTTEQPSLVSEFYWQRRKVSSGMLHRVALVRTDVSEEPSASVIRVTRISELEWKIQQAKNNVSSNEDPKHTVKKYLEYTVFLCSMHQLLVMANVVPKSPILVTLMMEALISSETSVLTRAPWHNVPQDAILHSHRHENLKSYIYWQLLWGERCWHCQHDRSSWPLSSVF
jgi:hypothetical protein